MKIIYRTSAGGYAKNKPAYVTPESCLHNFRAHFADLTDDFSLDEFILVADSMTSKAIDDTAKVLDRSSRPWRILRCNECSSGGSFLFAMDLALEGEDHELVYLVENDYIHTVDSHPIMLEGLLGHVRALGERAFVTLYDHADKYDHLYRFGETSKVFRTPSTHWKTTVSTTMTFACTVGLLRKHADAFRAGVRNGHPYDHEIFTGIQAPVISPLPGRATHGEIEFLAPGIDWERVMNWSLTEYPGFC